MSLLKKGERDILFWLCILPAWCAVWNQICMDVTLGQEEDLILGFGDLALSSRSQLSYICRG